jgi:hypothetical protein
MVYGHILLQPSIYSYIQVCTPNISVYTTDNLTQRLSQGLSQGLFLPSISRDLQFVESNATVDQPIYANKLIL